MGMTVDGLVSGINTTEMISQLMQLEAAPQSALKTKVSKVESFITALQGLNTRMSSLKESAITAGKATSWQAVTATSSAESVTTTAAPTALPSSLTFSVDRLAKGQTSLSGAATDLASFFDGAGIPTELTLVSGKDASSSTFTTVDLTNVTDFAGLAGAINKADAGVTATLVNVGGGQTRVQLTSKATGAASAIDLYQGEVTADTLAADPPEALIGRTAVADDADSPGSALVAAAQDALVTLWKGTGAEQPLTSATNTFQDVVAGVAFTVSKVETDAVTVTVGRDDAALKKLGSDLVANISTVLADIASRTKATTTKTGGRDVVTGGILSSDSATRQARQSILSALSMPVGGASVGSVGLVLSKEGTVTFDEKKFTAAMAADPANVQAVITEVAKRMESVGTTMSHPVTGALTTRIQGQQSYARNLNQQVDSWDNRLALRRTTLERTYSALEVSLSKINAQASWLSSQLEGMSTSSK